MSDGPQLRTARLLMRRWRDGDRVPFAALNAHPQVAATLAGPLTRAESDALLERIEAGFGMRGFGLWALEVVADGQFVGFTGLSVPTFPAPFLPAVEVGWRLAPAFWGHGYATEAALAALDFAFRSHPDGAGLVEVVSFTAATNVRSRAVMARIGMRHSPAEDFDHPAVPAASPLRRHVLYRISADQHAGAEGPASVLRAPERPASPA